MSISRKRVGSVSQRNDGILPPLDVQSIQMPPNPQNALALKTAALSSTKSLFQMASSLRKRLRNVEDFSQFLEQPPSAPQLDVVSHMCHVFRLGSSLAHLYNLLVPSFVDPSSPLYADLPEPAPIRYEPPNIMEAPEGVRNWAKRPEHAKACQKYIAMFCMALKQRREEGRWPGESWAVHELWGKSTADESDAEAYDSTGLMKVFQTVEAMLDYLPDSARVSPATGTPTTPHPTSASQSYSALAPLSRSNANSRLSFDLTSSLNGAPGGSKNVVNLDLDTPPALSPLEQQRASDPQLFDNAFKSVEELVSSERSYVQELEILERCSVEIVNAELISPDTNISIFSNLKQILDFQRKFLIKLETEYEGVEERGPTAWVEGRWGRPFVDMEKEFECYGPYCANYLEAIKVVNDYMVNLMLGQDLPSGQRPCLHPERELTAFMIKPIQRVTKYGLLLDAINHATAKYDYPYRKELEDGVAAVRRIAADINETTAHKAKQATVQELIERVDDWKGHDYTTFGELHLDDFLTVTKGDSPRDFHVFLFHRMMLCCKEITPDKKTKNGKQANMLRKDKTSSKGPHGPTKPKLALKGRIFVSNITNAVLLPPLPNEPYSTPRVQIVWSVPHKSGDQDVDVEDSFIMSGLSEENMKKWVKTTLELAELNRKHHAEWERHRERMRYSSNNRMSDGNRSHYHHSSFAPPTPSAEHTTFNFPPMPSPQQGPNGIHGGEHDTEEDRSGSAVNGLAIYGVPGVPFPAAANRRAQSQPIPPASQAELRIRAVTEDQNGPSMTQWRQQGTAPPLPPLPRVTSGGPLTGGTDQTWVGHSRRHPSQSRDFNDQHPPGAYARYDPQQQPPRGGMTRTPSQGVVSNGQQPPAPPMPTRSRSASSPNMFQQSQNAPLPPLPTSASGGSPAWAEANGPYPSGSATSSSTGLGSTPGGTAYFSRRMSAGKRSSQESQTTETSETSSQSPRTPYTNVTSSDLRGPTPVSRQNSGGEVSTIPSTVLVKVRSGESNFVIGVANDVSYQTLYEKVVKKLRLCSARHAAAGLDLVVKIKWLDSDGDEVVINTDSDVQIMLTETASDPSEQIQLIAV